MPVPNQALQVHFWHWITLLSICAPAFIGSLLLFCLKMISGFSVEINIHWLVIFGNTLFDSV